MDYKEKYEMALERARIWKDKSGIPKDKQGILDDIFPELKESEDDGIRKALIRAFESLNTIKVWNGIERTDILSWLEKQKEIDKASYEIAEKEKYDFVSGQFIECRKSFNEFKENNSYWFEYVGNDTYIGRSDNILNKKFHITPRQLYRLFTQQHCPKENNMNEETNAPTGYGKYVDECLNEAAKHFFSEGEDKYSVADLFYAGVRCGKSWSEKQGDKSQGKEALEAVKEEKADDSNKVEPKFHEGEWIIRSAEGFKHNTYLVKEVKDYYVCEELKGRRVTFTFNDVHKNFKLWDISDAKDGDVLAGKIDGDSYILIFKQVKDGWVETYGHYYDSVDRFCVPSQLFCRDYQGTFIPATKEQRVILFQKMHEAGYMWDSDSKQLLSLKAEPSNEQNSAWSEEDEKMFTKTLYFLDAGFNNFKVTEGIAECKSWVQFLKQRCTWKPSDEQIRALRWVLNNIPYNTYKEEISGLLEQIKDL